MAVLSGCGELAKFLMKTEAGMLEAPAARNTLGDGHMPSGAARRCDTHRGFELQYHGLGNEHVARRKNAGSDAPCTTSSRK